MPRPTQGQLIAAKLDKIGMSQSEFARQMELPRSQISKIINGHQKIPMERVPQAAEILKEDPDVLYVVAGQLPPDIRPIILAYPKLIRTIRNHHRVMMINAAEKPLYRRDVAGTMDGKTA